MANPMFQSLDEHENVFVGKSGSTERLAYEAKCAAIRAAELAYQLAGCLELEKTELDTELSAELVADRIKNYRKRRNLTQAELGDLMGVTKSQVSRLESSASNATIDTIQKVFAALGAKVSISIGLIDEAPQKVESNIVKKPQLAEVE